MRIAGRPASGAERRDDTHVAAIDREVEELRAVHAALGRLKRGEYGLCQTCGDEISAARLEQAPHAALCTVCDARAAQPGAPARRSDAARNAAQNRNV
jgi:DnaK suppressor protein